MAILFTHSPTFHRYPDDNGVCHPCRPRVDSPLPLKETNLVTSEDSCDFQPSPRPAVATRPPHSASRRKEVSFTGRPDIPAYNGRPTAIPFALGALDAPVTDPLHTMLRTPPSLGSYLARFFARVSGGVAATFPVAKTCFAKSLNWRSAETGCVGPASAAIPCVL